MNKQTIISISPSNNFFGFVVMDSWEIKATVPLSFKGLSQEVKLERLKNKISELIQEYKPELAVIEELEEKRETPYNRFILAQAVCIVTEKGLPVKFLTNKAAKKALCSDKTNPTWQDAVEKILTMPNMSSFPAKNLLEKFIGRRMDSEEKTEFRLYPLTKSKRYYWNALSALVIGSGYFNLINNQIHYDYNTTEKTGSPDNGDCR